jgi:hypothetical protein
MTTTNGTDQVEGLVEAVNDRGIRVAGEWRNVSRFHPVDLPDRGARVRLELDSKRLYPLAPGPRPGAIVDTDELVRSRSRHRAHVGVALSCDLLWPPRHCPRGRQEQ